MLVPSPPSPPTTQLRFPDVEAATSLATLDDQAACYARARKAANTIRSYRVDLADFQAWYDAHALPWLPATAKTIGLCPPAGQGAPVDEDRSGGRDEVDDRQ